MRDSAEQSELGQQVGGRALWVRWVLAHVLLITLTWGAVIWLASTSFYGVGGLFALPFAIVAPFLAQWIGIRRALQLGRDARWWVVATVIGCVLPILLLAVVLLVFGPRGFSTDGLSLALYPAVFGTALGLAQWAVLQRHVRRAAWWVPANAFGLIAAVFAAPLAASALSPLCQSTATMPGLLSGPSVGYCGLLGVVVTLVTGTAVFSAITGAALVWLLNQQGVVHPVISGRYLALGAVAVSLGIALVAAGSFFAFQSSIHDANRIMYGVSMVSPDEGWAIADENEGAAIFHYSGGSWTEVSLPHDLKVNALRDISMASTDEGWSVGDGTTLLHYSKGTWSKVGTPAGVDGDLYMASVQMLSPSEGWVIGKAAHGGASTLIHYNNGKWASVPNPTSEILMRLYFDSPEDGWAVGYNGTVLHYTKGAWQRFTSPTTNVLSSVHMLSPTEGWMAGGTVLYHLTGGKWSNEVSLTGSDIASISMVSPQEGWVVGNDQATREGSILQYKGGRWATQAEVTPGMRILNGLSMLPSGEGWAAGEGSTLLHYKDGRWTKYQW
ncbi:MAG: WD40/YVTN/BNR-like repeat-containing protein [Chloroflexia bacterium]